MTHGSNPLQSSYDSVAREYAERFRSELDHKPFDRLVLDRFATATQGQGVVADVGCGPGQIARYLSERGVDAVGLDLSPEMIACARRENPGIPFDVGDMQHLPVPDGAWAGIAAFYSIIHIPRDEVTATLFEFLRVLAPSGRLLLACHLGNHSIHLDEWFDAPVDVDFHHFERSEMEGYLRAAGFVLEEVEERDPYPGVEAETRRAYFLATNP